MRIKNEGVEKRCRCRKGVIRPFYFLHLLSIFYAFAATAAIPLTWQVDTTRVAPVTFDAYHGETLALEAVFKDASRPLDLTGKTANLYWQTNGMESVYWATNAVVERITDNGQRIETNWCARATFDGAMDPGAASVRGFLAVGDQQPATNNQQLSSLNYRAAFVIRFRPSPGFEPATLPLPTRTLDFATTEVRNAPYWTKAESDARYSGGGGGVSTNAVSGIITNHVTSGYLCTVAEARQMTNATLAAAKSDAHSTYLRKGVYAGTQEIGASFNLATLTHYGTLNVKKDPLGVGGLLNVDATLATEKARMTNLEVGQISSASNWSVAEGFQSVASGKLSHAAGYRANATKDTAFVWQGTSNFMAATNTNYYDHGKGTFNVNPAGGLAGFWIGETNMATHIGNAAYTKAVADARFAPTNVAVAVAEKIDAAGALGVFNANADYLLVNLADNATAATLASGTIANLATSGNALDVTLSLGANDRSADALLRIVNTQDVALGIGNQGVALDGSWPSTIKAGTNLVMFCKTAYKNNTAVITVTSKEIK